MTALRMLAALALVCVALFSSDAKARQRHRTYAAHADCNLLWPCEGVAPSARGGVWSRQWVVSAPRERCTRLAPQ